MIIGLIGRKGSGKGTVAKILAEEHDAHVYRMSEVLRSIATDLHIPVERKNLIAISETLRKHFGESILGEAITTQIQNDTAELYVIDGIRRQADLDGFHELDMTLVHVTAPIETRFERILHRGENDEETTMTREQFEELEHASTETTIKDIEHQATLTIENTGSLENLREKIQTLLAQ